MSQPQHTCLPTHGSRQSAEPAWDFVYWAKPTSIHACLYISHARLSGWLATGTHCRFGKTPHTACEQTADHCRPRPSLAYHNEKLHSQALLHTTSDSAHHKQPCDGAVKAPACLALLLQNVWQAGAGCPLHQQGECGPAPMRTLANQSQYFTHAVHHDIELPRSLIL